jgi:ribonuclease D
VTADRTELITSSSQLGALVERWRAEAIVGIDTEAASFHRYRDRVYLLQLSTAAETAVVDPLATGGIGALGDWLAGGATEFVFHDADYDIRLIHRDAGLRVGRLFDTRIAAQFLNLPSIGLGAILETRFGVRTNKRFQRADWSARPLSPEMIEYAANDTRFLPALRGLFRAELEARGRLGWVEEECALQLSLEWPAPEDPETAFRRLKGARDLDRRGLAILRELHAWREAVAARTDRALFRVLGTDAMIRLSTIRPRTPAELGMIPGVGPETVVRRGDEILAAIERGLAVPDADLPAFPRRPRHRPDPAFETRLERLKRWRAGAAIRHDLAPGLLAPNATLEALARAMPASAEALTRVPGVRRWQAAEFGGEVLALIEP